MALFTLAHVSDLHVTARPGSVSARRLVGKRMVGLANLTLGGRARRYRGAERRVRRLTDDVRAMAVDHVVCTGDLTTLSLESEFARVAEALGPLCDDPGRLSVVPGNHDRYTRRAAQGRFERWLGRVSSPSGEYPFVRSVGSGITLVGLDLARPTMLADCSGRCGVEQRRRLEAILTDPSLTHRFVIVAMHHGFFRPDGRPETRWQGIRDGARLMASLDRRELHVDLILHGHVHQPFASRTRRRRVLCAGSATDLGAACGYNLLRLDPATRAVEVERRRWDPRSGRYVA